MRGLVGLLLTAGLAAGQPPLLPPATRPAVATQPGTPGWPTEASPTVPPGLPSGQATAETRRPGSPLPQYPAPAPAPAPGPTAVLTAPPVLVADDGSAPAHGRPLPGSNADLVNAELAARQAFTACDYTGTRYVSFPSTLLWEPPLASKREPRLQLLLTDFENYTNNWTLDANIGTTVGLYRVEPPGHDTAYQLDLFANVLTRLSPEDLIATDYRFGVPLTAKWGCWQGKLAYEHTSAHLGDEFARNTGLRPTNFAKDEVVVGVGRFLLDRRLRVYGQVSYAFFQDLFGDPERWRYDLGGQWDLPAPTGLSGAPFVALHLDWRGDQDYRTNLTAQAGWAWRNPLQRLAGLRVFGEYYTGGSPFGQFYRTRERFAAFGVGGEF